MKVKVAFYKGRSTAWDNFWADLVRWWTNGPYSHTEIITRQEGDQSYSHTSVIGISSGGISSRWRKMEDADWDFVEVEADPEVVEGWFKRKDSAKYDLPGLLGFVFRRDDYSRDKYFCSEAVAASLGIKEAWRYDPNALKPIIDVLSTYHKD